MTSEPEVRPRRVAYLVNQYPKVSHSFIRREILALERQGVTLLRFAVRGWDGELPDPADRSERESTRYVLQHGLLAPVLSTLRLAVSRPGRFFRALRLAAAMWRRSDRTLFHHAAYLAEACHLVGWLEAAGADHLHAHFGTNPAEVAMLAHALGGPPYSFTVHGPEEFDRPQALGLGEKGRRAAFVVAISSFGRSQLLRWLPADHWPKVAVVHCGLEQAFHRGTPVDPSLAPRLVCVGRLCEQKGQLLLVEATRRVVDAGHSFELVLAGDGEMRAEVEALIDTLDLRSHVRITGWISSDRVREEILAARALVLPSFAEGLPVVIMEAMALRRPVITTFVAGIPELVRDGENGWLVPAGDVVGLAEAMCDCLAASADVLARMGRDAHGRALARHDVDTEAAKLAALFAAAGGGRAGAGREARMSWHDALGLALLLLSAVATVPAAVLLLELVAAAWRGDAWTASQPVPARAGTLAVLMPAHDEAAGIEASIRAALPQLAPGDRLLVVADNCSDATAAVARAAGAEVVERHDSARRGKGYALDHGVRWLEQAPPAVVIVLDADCIAAPGALQRLAGTALQAGRPVQGLDLMHAPAGARLEMRIAAFAWIVKNTLRPLGAAVLGWPCQLMGTGMAFPWPMLRDAQLATGHLVEDMQLGLDLARAGALPLFCPAAAVSSMFPADRAAAGSQRTRWEHGHLSTLVRVGPRLLGLGVIRFRPGLVAMALDLMVPPLAALVLLLAALFAADAAWWLWTGDPAPLAIVTAALAFVGTAVMLAWRRGGRALLGGRELLGLPFYVAAKLPMYLRLLGKRQVEWVRTKRDDPGR